MTALPYRFDPATSRFSAEALQEMQLDPELLSQIVLQHRNRQFTAAGVNSSNIEYWPYILRWDEFQKSRTAFEAARDEVLKDAGENGQASVAAIMNLQSTTENLFNEFQRSQKVRQWMHEHGRYLQFSSCERFLKDLKREVERVENTGDLRPLRSEHAFDPRNDGGHLVAFLSFLNRSGITFAPAKPGDEAAYHSLFTMMRALYLTVEDDDESTTPQDLRKALPQQ
ncbi:MAG: hypothetical protein R3C49_06570 [Planctomycetaceae bacterium]